MDESPTARALRVLDLVVVASDRRRVRLLYRSGNLERHLGQGREHRTSVRIDAPADEVAGWVRP